MLSAFLQLLQQGGAGGVLVAGGAGQVPTYATTPNVTGIRTADGTVGAPAYGFTSEPLSGRYRIGLNNLGEAINGVLVYDWNASRIKVAQPIQIPDGTSAAPPLAFSSASNDGLYHSGTREISVAFGGSRTFTFNSSTGFEISTASNVFIIDDGNNVLAQKNGANAQTGRWYANTVAFAQLNAGNVSTAPAAATGLVINNAGDLTRMIRKVTLSSTHTAFQAAATAADVTLFTTAAKTRVMAVIADTTVAWAGPAGTLAFTMGKTAGGNEYLVTHDVKTGVVTKGLADADFGTAMIRATAIQTGDLPSWTTTTAVQCRLTSGTGNLGTGAATNLTNGTTTFYVIYEVYP